ncbi:MAG: ornithine carbamoyltransferase [Rickettsiales bacterium]|nr:ornithine carbamoyltransferase [Rickettsiales bacterium]
MPFVETQYPIRHFIDLREIPKEELRKMIDTAKDVKQGFKQGFEYAPLPGKIMGMVFEKPSTRTRISFEVGMRDLGGYSIYMSEDQIQIGHGESISDTAKVMSRFIDCIMIRANKHETVLGLAEHGHIPVINGLTDKSHPCQIMADVMTIEEHRGPIAGKTLAWVGDGNNVATSLIEAAAQFDFTLHLSCPPELQPSQEAIGWARDNGATIELFDSPQDAVINVDAIFADCWVSMGDKDADFRHKVLAPYQVNAELMALAKADALFMHCLPAHRGEEVTAEVIDGPQSVVFDEAENRLHAQKAVILWCFKQI